MQKSPPLHSSRHHHKQLLWLCHQPDQSQHLPWWIALPRVIQTKRHHKETMGITKTIQHTNNFLIPDGSDRRIHDIQDKTFHRGILGNGHNAYLVELPDLKSLLRTSRYLMDEVTGQFYAVFGNSYKCMCTIPRLTHTWQTGQLIDELPVTKCALAAWDQQDLHPPQNQPATSSRPSWYSLH